MFDLPQLALSPDRPRDHDGDRAELRGNVSDKLCLQSEMRRYAENRRFRVEIECNRAVEKLMEEGLNGRIALDDVAGDSAEQGRTQPDQNRKPVEHHHD